MPRAIVLPLLAVAAFGQTSGPAFEVASVKPGLLPRDARAAGREPGMHLKGARVDIVSMNLRGLILDAHQVKPYQLTGPDWIAANSFDIQAELPDGATTAQVPAMLQALLAERFKLVVRRETKEQPVYALAVGKDGIKLKESLPGAGTADKPFPNGRGGRIVLMVVETDHGFHTTSRLNGKTVFESEKISLEELATALIRYVDLPVVDMTGLKGFHQVVLTVPDYALNSGRGARGGPRGMDGADPGRPAYEAAEPPGGSIFTSVQKIGLRLERRTVPMEHLTVEHLGKTPTEN